MAVIDFFFHIDPLSRLVYFEIKPTALVASKLDYCNGLLYNVTNREINRLQGVQNCLARVVTRSPRFCRTTPLLRSLHWLPVSFRIHFKIGLVTFKALCNNQPIYLKEMLKPLSRTRDLRSSDQNLLLVPRVRTKMGEGSFSVAAPKLWNCLPYEIRMSKTVQSFRTNLKTFYFNQAFPT